MGREAHDIQNKRNVKLHVFWRRNKANQGCFVWSWNVQEFHFYKLLNSSRSHASLWFTLMFDNKKTQHFCKEKCPQSTYKPLHLFSKVFHCSLPNSRITIYSNVPKSMKSAFLSKNGMVKGMQTLKLDESLCKIYHERKQNKKHAPHPRESKQQGSQIFCMLTCVARFQFISFLVHDTPCPQLMMQVMSQGFSSIN